MNTSAFRPEFIALALTACADCHGTAYRSVRGKYVVCACVERSVFGAVMRRFRQIAQGERFAPAVNLERVGSGSTGYSFYGRKNEEYISDVVLTARRTLDETEYKLFSYCFLLGADWRLCCKRLGLPFEENKHKRMFFHYRKNVEVKLGRAFRSLRPYSLLPDQYFAHAVRGSKVPTTPVNAPAHPQPLRAPLVPCSAAGVA